MDSTMSRVIGFGLMQKTDQITRFFLHVGAHRPHAQHGDPGRGAEAQLFGQNLNYCPYFI
jgi:hypothetical protein